MQPQPVFDTKPLLRPHQVADAKEEIASLEAQMASPHVEDKNEVYKKLIRSKQTFETQVPRAPASVEEEGRMVAREKEILDSILVGMPSQEEMRKAPPGAVDKHMKWERRNKRLIAEWKNLRLRLNPGEREAANLERHRPTSSSLNMDNAYIPGKQIYIPEGVGATVTFNDAQIAVLRMVSPQLADALSLMSNQQRAQVKAAVEIASSAAHGSAGSVDVPATAGLGMSAEPERSAEKPKRVMSQAQKDALAAGRAKKAAEKKASKA
jgi:hypothetical protein